MSRNRNKRRTDHLLGTRLPRWNPDGWITTRTLAIVAAVILVSSAAAAAIIVPMIFPARYRAPEVVAVVADISDEISRAEHVQIERRLTSIVEGLPRNDQMIIAQLTATVSAPLTVHLMEVAPPKAEDCKLVGCTPPGYAKDRSEKLRIQPGTRAVRRSLQPGKRPLSPVLEGAIAIARMPEFKSDDPATPKTLVLVTDGLQNTDCTFYRRLREGSKADKKKSDVGFTAGATAACQRLLAQAQGLFGNTSVEILFITRTPAKGGDFQTHDMKEWLERFFLNNGARQVRITELR